MPTDRADEQAAPPAARERRCPMDAERLLVILRLAAAGIDHGLAGDDWQRYAEELDTFTDALYAAVESEGTGPIALDPTTLTVLGRMEPETVVLRDMTGDGDDLDEFRTGAWRLPQPERTPE